ncbi:YkvI family membrane protein [Paenibacillus koleovorans]|uniref:YkvI family membrane protein n=1 Tax=Paenibacillus koleovorans TaxID=121608 RepID=UPI000FDCC27E|nr:alanine:cation symporter family protein [Paenibacillus koleovorans]
MKAWVTVLQIAFTYIGTVVGAGFATGQEILQFFSRYGWMATLTIGVAGILFVWLGTRVMLLAHKLQAESYEDLNRYLFGHKLGQAFSWFSLVVLFGINAVMLAGAGSVFHQHFNLPYQYGLLLTLVLAYLVITGGLKALMAVNSFVVPMMFIFSALMVTATFYSPNAGNWFTLTSDYNPVRIWTAPLLYVAFNLATAQAVLVPLGAATKNPLHLKRGGWIGGIGITLMLLGGHFALSSQMPGIAQFEIPMTHLIARLGHGVQLAFVAVIFGEIFTTLIANVYGLTLQLQQRSRIGYNTLVLAILMSSFLVSQIGFSTLLTTLYPLFGMVSMLWFVRMIRPSGRLPFI